MKLIKTIQFADVNLKNTEGFSVRRAARAVVFDNNKNVGILYVSKHDYHKLPGGGLKGGESIEAALQRECLEEIGCRIEILGELGEILEYRIKRFLKQYSYCYLARVLGDKGKPSFTPKEMENGFMIKWVPLREAIELLENDKTEDYEGKFIKIRDYNFLQEAEKHII